MPGSPKIVKRCARPSRTVRAKVFSSSSSSVSRPTSGARGPDGPSGAVGRVHDAPRPQLPVHALELERARILDDERPGREAVGRRADEDLARPRRLLEPRCKIDGLAGDEGGIGVLDDDLARLDTDTRLDAELDDRLAHREGRTSRAQRVVLVRLRYAEGRENCVAGELLDDAAVDRHAVRDQLEEAVHAPPHDLGVGRGDEARRVDDVHEQHGCELPLHD